MNFEEIHALAVAAAAEQGKADIAQYGDTGACGFANIKAYVKLSTKLGKAMKACGFERSWNKGIVLYNPARLPVQSIFILERAANAYAGVLCQNGIRCYVESRLD